DRCAGARAHGHRQFVAVLIPETSLTRLIVVVNALRRCSRTAVPVNHATRCSSYDSCSSDRSLGCRRKSIGKTRLISCLLAGSAERRRNQFIVGLLLGRSGGLGGVGHHSLSRCRLTLVHYQCADRTTDEGRDQGNWK